MDDAHDDAQPAATPFPARYVDLGPVARGGWGEVRRIHDRVIDRVAVAKILAWEHLDSPPVRARFTNEARITASLDHPGVVPVIDGGTLQDGRPWFAMKEVRGRTLAELLAEHDDSAQGTVRLRRFVEILIRIAETIAYAHERRVVHRDLKPGNVMIGAFGEVMVLDWGVARAVGDAPDRGAPPSHGDAWSTEAGEILGTVAYMAPEQARGAREEIGPGVDIYSLGMILFEILAGRRAREGSRVAMWAQATCGEMPQLASGPSELRALVGAATDASPGRRPGAMGFASALRAWLDGAARVQRADAAVALASELVARIEDLRAERDAVRASASSARAALRGDDPADSKHAMWAFEDRVAKLDVELVMLEETRIQALRSALEHDREHAPAHVELARVYRTRLLESERARSEADAARWELLLRQHDRGDHAAFLRGTGRVVLDTSSSGAEIVAHRWVAEHRRLVPRRVGVLGRTPIDVELPGGSYVLEIASSEGRMRYPVMIGRDETWSGIRPGATSTLPIVIPRDLGEDDIFVAPGWTQVGDDELAVEPVPARRLWVDGFVIRRYPVTCANYLAFLDDLASRGEVDLAMRYAPASSPASGAPLPAVVRQNGRFAMAPDEHGRVVDPQYPIASVDWHAARAYARWYAERTGLAWRLPNEIEWEKAARGVDARRFPWGYQPEPTWACVAGTRRSTDDPPRRSDVTAFPVDESPYGVRGMAGNVRDWCCNEWKPDGPVSEESVVLLDAASDEPSGLLAIRGGAWTSAVGFARCAGRFAAKADERFTVVGFRLARSAG